MIGIEDGREEGRIEVIKAFLSNGGTVRDAERLLNVSAEEIARAKERLTS